MRQLYDENPGMEEAFRLGHQKIEEQIKERENLRRHGHSIKEAESLIRIPVVFHVLIDAQDTAGTDLSDERINSEIQFLNEWFSASNTHYNSASDYWKSQNVIAEASDFQIQFQLASISPSGQTTNGINRITASAEAMNNCRTATSTSSITRPFRTADGGQDAWDTLLYLNVWVCPLTAAAGFAFFPNKDGVTTHYRDGMLVHPVHIGDSYRGGSISAHEAGHWLGLYHTFNGCNNGDQIDDTPDSDTHGLTKANSPEGSSWRQSCPNDESGLTDTDFMQCGSPGSIAMVQNCMDYNYEECKSYFSKGQVAHMRGVLLSSTTSRSEIRTSPGLGSGGGSNCSPDCSELSKICGSDGCGGTCGSCNGFDTCSADGTTCNPCVPQCPGNCGDNSCGGSCGTCGASETCSNGNCVTTQTSPLKQAIIDFHNNLRANVSPPPVSPLTPLTYSNSVAAAAAAWASDCPAGFEDFSSAPYSKNRYSINGDKTNDAISFTNRAMEAWASKKANYTLTTDGETCSVSNCGSYKIMIWDNDNYPTDKVGCAIQYCSGDDRTYLLCYYDGPGNYVGMVPYTPCSGQNCPNSGCSSECTPGQCGQVINGCGNSIFCGCCDATCQAHTCGEFTHSCDGGSSVVNCGNCPSGSSCVPDDNGNNQCVTDPGVCDHQTECQANSATCGAKNYCGVTAQCGTCAANEICSEFTCVPNPCGGSCGQNEICDSNDNCVCATGFTKNSAGVCAAVSAIGTPLEQIIPEGASNFVTQGDNIVLTTGGEHLLGWPAAVNIVDKYTTRISAEVRISEGEFGLSIRSDQSRNSLDRIMWTIRNIGSSPTAIFDMVFHGGDNDQSNDPISWSPLDTHNVTVTMGFSDDYTSITTRLYVDSTYISGFYVRENYYPDLGSVSFYFDSPEGVEPSLSNVVLVTSSSIHITLAGCIDENDWSDMFYTLTGADRNTVSVQVRVDGENGLCSSKSAGKAFVSGFTTIVTSSSVPAASLGSKLVASVGGSTAATLGLESATVIPGTAGANLAGLPGIAGLSAAGGGGGGGGAGGGGGGAALSGGAIAGIVVGSVAGSILLVGVAAVVVAAVVAGAVIMSKDSESSPEATEPNKRASVRKTIIGMFSGPRGGVDVMNDPKGHQSISNRSPAV
eukprot:CAMPEP_0117048014 /NCGR_PEP_ID=MMETSP0472-20121206/33175_1 /TAXON_ID=693140 ORGANISM="Tiarina fusus, Strain LIS" /NCGR_SAMPLE_ID=MMETSP0472 /ASSEMBLY_ACC=CAM_ASM_000603 /LENGTH=1139 /DNA_ID=CAMNT_0004760921 /DNA_START=128 /DNA_END=3547 /DNA_ORIENTATION=-